MSTTYFNVSQSQSLFSTGAGPSTPPCLRQGLLISVAGSKLPEPSLLSAVLDYRCSCHTSNFHVGFENLNSGQGLVASVFTTEPSPELHFLFLNDCQFAYSSTSAVMLLVPETVGGRYDSLILETPVYTVRQLARTGSERQAHTKHPL